MHVDFWAVVFFGGLIGSVFMDVVEIFMGKVGLHSGVTGSHIGKWAYGLLRGKIVHADIEATPHVKNELKIAFVFHYVVGGGGVALAYPVMLYIIGISNQPDHILPAIFYGLLTCALPWFVLMPSMGKGIVGRKMRLKASPITAPILSHLAYGFGLGLTLNIYGKVLV